MRTRAHLEFLFPQGADEPLARRLSFCLETSSCSPTCSPSGVTQHKSKILNRRKRKSSAQVKILKDEYSRNPYWTKKVITALSENTGLSESQIYKWSWDYRKKLRTQKPVEVDPSLVCHELLAPSPLDLALYLLQRSYRQAVSSKALSV